MDEPWLAFQVAAEPAQRHPILVRWLCHRCAETSACELGIKPVGGEAIRSSHQRRLTNCMEFIQRLTVLAPIHLNDASGEKRGVQPQRLHYYLRMPGIRLITYHCIFVHHLANGAPMGRFELVVILRI